LTLTALAAAFPFFAANLVMSSLVAALAGAAAGSSVSSSGQFSKFCPKSSTSLYPAFSFQWQHEGRGLNTPLQLVRTSLDGHSGTVESHGEEGSLSLHSRVSSLELDLGERERVTSVKGSVHVRVGHAPKELGVLLTKLIGVGDGVLLESRSVGLVGLVLSPELLVLLLDRNESIALLGL
jgi:hypothetical protein